MIRKYILSKFLACFVPVFLLFTGVSLYFLAEWHIKGLHDQIGARLGSQIGKVTGLLDEALVTEHPKVAADVISTIMVDPAVTCIDAHHPSPITCFPS